MSGRTPPVLTETRESLSSTFGMPGRAVLTNGQNLAASARLLRAARYRPFNLAVAGNSIVVGQYAENVGTIDDSVLRHRGFVGQMRSLFAERYGAPGEGVVILGDSRVTKSGASNISTTGITQNTGMRLDAAAEYVEIATGEPCTEVWIHGWWESDAKCPNSIFYTVDGGGSTEAVIGPLGSDKYWTYKITGLSDAAHTIRVTGQDAEQIDLAGFQLVNTLTDGGGVRVHRYHSSGGYVSDASGVFYLSTGTAASALRNRILTLGTGMAHSADLLVLAFGANEVTPTGESAGWTSTKYETELRSVVDYATATHGCDVLLVTTGRRTTGLGTNGEFDEAIHAEIAADTARVAHLNVAADWGTWTQADAKGFMYDTVHPNLTGHSHMAHLIHQALSTI